MLFTDLAELYKILYKPIMFTRKAINWLGPAYEDLQDFPTEARREAGFQLGQVQAGLEPDNWKPFDEIGSGTREIRLRDPKGAFRVLYVAKFEEAVYVLHAFQKKTQTTGKQDKAIAKVRYRALVQRREVKP